MIRSACIAYSLLNYDDVPSLDNFISSYVKGFEESNQGEGANVLTTPTWMTSLSLKENETKEENRSLLSPVASEMHAFSIDDM